jgi:hypothetical protein
MTVPHVVPALMNVPLKRSLRAISTKLIRMLAPIVELAQMFVRLKLFILNNLQNRIKTGLNGLLKARPFGRAFLLLLSIEKKTE